MATPAADASAAQAAQAGLVTALSYDIQRTWNVLDVSSLRDTLPKFTAAVAALVHRYGAASATLAARSYRAERAAAGVRSAFTVRPAPLPPLPQIAATVRWATDPLWSAQPNLDVARKKLTGATDMLVLDVGRQTIIDSVSRDRRARGWARVPEADPCYFCAMLATRGAVYKTEGTAGRNSNARFTGTGQFKSHDHCRCHAEPVFTAYEPSAQVREWQALYKDATRGVTGMKAAQQAWRQAFTTQQ